MPHVDPIIEYKVWYELNPEYEGDFQTDKIAGRGLHGTFGASSGGLSRARKEVEACKKWFNTESWSEEVPGENGKPKTEVHSRQHDNVRVWIEKYIDGFPAEEPEDAECPAASDESPPPKLPKGKKRELEKALEGA